MKVCVLVKSRFLGLFFLFFVGVVFATEESSNKSDVKVSLASMGLENSGLEKNLQHLEDYYTEVNQRLDERLSDRVRDPFQQMVRVRDKKTLNRKTVADGVEKSSKQSSVAAKVKESMSSVLLRPRSVGIGELPVMQFKGYLKVDGVSAALLDVDGVGSVVVKEGDKVGVGQVDQDDAVIKIVQISKLNVIVEVGSLGERVVVQ